MSRKIQFKRGLKRNLPQLDEAEFGMTTDTKELFVGSVDGNVKIARQDDVNGIAGQIGDLSQSVSVQLEKKANDVEVRKKTVKIEPEDFSSNALGLVTGQGNVNLLSIPQENSITPTRLGIGVPKLQKSKNLFNKVAITDGFFVISTTGSLQANVDYWTSEYIEILPGTSYAQSHDTHKAFYDINKTYISGQQAGTGYQNFLSPSNARFVRVSGKKTSPNLVTKDVYQLEAGSSFTSYESFKYFVPSIENGVKVNLLPNNYVKKEYIDGTEWNLFDVSRITEGFLLNDADGTNLISANYGVSDFIPVQANKKYVISKIRTLGFYNTNKVFITGSGINKNPIESNFIATPTEDGFLKVSSLLTDLKTGRYMVVEGDNMPVDYSQPGRYIPWLKINPAINVNWHSKIWSQLGDSITQQNKWQTYVSERTGLISKNYGIGGTKVADVTGSDTQAMCRDERINALDINSQLVSFMGGTNDWAGNVPIGTISDNGVDTFYGAVKKVTQKLVTRFPTARILFMTTPYGKYPNRSIFTDPYGLVNALGYTTGDYGKVIMEVARLYGIPCLDVYGNAGWNDINIATYLTNDGAYLHPNTEGGKRIAEIVVGKLKSIEPIS